MNKQKIQAILEKLPIEGEGAHGEFVLALGDIHKEIANALQVAPSQPLLLGEDDKESFSDGHEEGLFSPDGDDGWSGPTWGSEPDYEDSDYEKDPYYEGVGDLEDAYDSEYKSEEETSKAFMKKLHTELHSRFNEGGVLSAAEYLMIVLQPSGVEININEESEETVENVNFFIREYGFREFFEHEFKESLYYNDDADERGSLRDFSTPIMKAPKSDVQLESLHEPHSSDALSKEMFEAVSGVFSVRQDNWPIEPPQNLYKGSLDPVQTAFTSVNTTDKFFEAENSGNNYAQRLKAAREGDDHITPLNFHPIFKRLGRNATGLTIDESVTPPTVSVSLDKMTALRQAVGLEIDTIRQLAIDMQHDLESAARREEDRNLREALLSYNKKRRGLSNRVDDLLSAIKKRDAFITDLLYRDYRKQGFEVNKALRSREYELSSEFRSADNAMAIDLAFICSQLVFVDIQTQVFHLGEGEGSSIPSKFRENYDAVSDIFKEVFMHQLHNKIQAFFSISASGAWARSSFCSWIARGLQRAILCHLAYNRAFNVKTKHWNYSSCAVCGKNIYTRTAIKSPKGSGRKGRTVEKSEYSEYDIPLYSLFTERGDLITEGVLNQKEGGFPPPESHPEYEGPKTWQEIKSLVSSGSKREHLEGVVRRAEAFVNLGPESLARQAGLYL